MILAAIQRAKNMNKPKPEKDLVPEKRVHNLDRINDIKFIEVRL